MRIAKYWASVVVYRDHPDFPDGPLMHRVWAGSDESVADAEQAAAAQGELVRATRPPKPADTGWDEYWAYTSWSQPEPLIDEVFDEEGARVGGVTINRYGVDVLNTTAIAFVDVDAPEPFAVFEFFRRLLGRTGRKESYESRSISSLKSWIEADAGRGVRVYRTAAGLRYMIIRPTIDPAADGTQELFKSLQSDERYTVLCRVQQNYRARLTPKPWRIGMSKPKIRYDEYVAESEEIRAWLAEYRLASESYATCRLLHEFGDTTPPDAGVASLIELHDTIARVGSDLPLA